MITAKPTLTETIAINGYSPFGRPLVAVVENPAPSSLSPIYDSLGVLESRRLDSPAQGDGAPTPCSHSAAGTHLVTPSPCHPFTLSPLHPVTPSPCHPVKPPPLLRTGPGAGYTRDYDPDLLPPTPADNAKFFARLAACSILLVLFGFNPALAVTVIAAAFLGRLLL